MPSAGDTRVATDAHVQKHFFCRLIPPRPTFAQDMSTSEGATMQEHMAYWGKLLEAGNAIVYGPVADPKGAWGLAVVRATDERMRTIEAEDPAILSGIGMRYEVFEMLRAVVGK